VGERFRGHVALIVGLGGLLAIMAVAGVGALRVLQNVRGKDETIRRQFLSRNHVLNDIRSKVYLSGTLVRDYLLEPEPSRAETYRSSLEQIRRQMDAALESYGRESDPEQVQQYMALRSELDGYWETLAPVFQWNADQRGRLGYPFLRDEVFPRRQNMLGIADRIADFNEQQLTAGNAQVAELLSGFQDRLGVTLLAALVLGLGMAAFSVRQILKLEARERARFEEVAGARAQLTDLSAKLVQAQETERRALSRELHDEVGQSLSAVLIELRNLSAGLGVRTAEQSRAEAIQRVEEIKSLVESTVRVVRNMALLLRPSMLDDLGLVPALRWQAREISKRTSMDVIVAAELTSDNLPDDYKTCIYRVVQEALHNCARHSNAGTVRVRVQQAGGRLTLSIQDDGLGFDTTQMKGLGLLGIQERVNRLGGICRVHSAPGRGTVLSVELPVPSGQPAAQAVHT
jgi:signal transduction histidine kinase